MPVFRSLASFIVALACFTAVPHAHALEPGNASSLVTLIADAETGVCPATTSSRTFGDRLLANGMRIRFVIPSGQVLVVTALEWVVDQTTRFDETAWAALDLFDGTRYQHAFVSSGRFDVRGRAASNAAIRNGVVVRPGTPMCFRFDGSFGTDRSFALIHGFLAPDS